MRRLLTKLSNQWHSHPDDCWPSGLEVLQQLRSRTARPVMWYLTTVHDLSPFLVLHTTAKSLCLPADALWNGSKYSKPEKLHFFSPPLPPSLPTVTPLQIPLLLSWCETWSRQREVFESFGPRQVLLVTSSCGRPTRKGARTPVLYFLITQPARASKTKPKKKKTTACFENKRLWSCCCLMQRGKKRWERRYRCCVIFFSPSVFCKLAVTQFSKSFVFLFFLFPSASQVTFQCRDIPSETLRLHNLKKKKKRQKDEANLLLPPLPLPLALTLFLSLAAGVWYNSLNVVIADSRLRWRENRRGVASLSDPDNATFLPV